MSCFWTLPVNCRHKDTCMNRAAPGNWVKYSLTGWNGSGVTTSHRLLISLLSCKIWCSPILIQRKSSERILGWAWSLGTQVLSCPRKSFILCRLSSDFLGQSSSFFFFSFFLIKEVVSRAPRAAALWTGMNEPWHQEACVLELPLSLLALKVARFLTSCPQKALDHASHVTWARGSDCWRAWIHEPAVCFKSKCACFLAV